MEMLCYLRTHPYQEIELVGVVTNICVISNAVLCKAALPEARVSVDASLCASNDEALHEKALDVMRGLQINVTNKIEQDGQSNGKSTAGKPDDAL